MENKLIIETNENKEMYVYLYIGYYDKPVVSFQFEEEPSWSPNPFCYNFDTFLEINNRGLLIDGDSLNSISIDYPTVQKVQSFIKEYKGEYLKSGPQEELKSR